MATIIPNSEVRLIKNVPFSNNYKNVIQFNDRTSQENYFKGLPNLALDNFKYVRNNGTIKVPYYRDEILEYNYLMFKNKAYGDKYFYAFITNISYINPNTSAISFELDVFQTWFMDVEFKPSYVEREHCQRWNSDGTPVINTIPEGLDYGGEYQYKGYKRLYDVGMKNKIKWIVIATSLDVNDIGGILLPSGEADQDVDKFMQIYSSQALANNIAYVVVPLYEYGVCPTWYLAGYSTALKGAVDVVRGFRYYSKLVNKAVSIFVTDYLPCEYEVTQIQNGIEITSSQITPFYVYAEDGANVLMCFMTIPQNDDTQNESFKFNIMNNKYEYLKSGITESKLLMYPYSYNLLTDLQGDEFIIKNEYVNGNNINVLVRSALNISNNVSYSISNYLNSSGIERELYLANGIINKNTNRLSVVDDYAAAYAQGNMNTIAQNIIATRQQSALNNQIASNTAQTNSAVTDTRNSSMVAQAGVNAVGATFSTIGNLATGNIAGAIGSSANGVAGVANSIIQAEANSTITDLENKNMLVNTGLRGELANQQAVAGAMAKIQDARNMADNVNLQGGDTYFNYGYENLGVKVISYQITPEYIDLLQDYFGKYGYKVHKVKIPNIHTRESWNYIQTVGANIVGNIPQMFIDALEQLFNQGITIWHTTDVGNYNLSNDEI